MVWRAPVGAGMARADLQAVINQVCKQQQRNAAWHQ